MGISQAYVTYRYDPDFIPGVKTHLKVKGGAFWDRFGYLEHYDTYIFGRTHQLGEQVRLDVQKDDVTLSILDGIGAHPEDISSNQAFSLLHHARASASYRDIGEAGLYYLRTWSQEKPQ